MNILFYRYGSICEPDMIKALKELQIEVMEITEEITDKTITSSRRIQLISAGIEQYQPLFVFSINYYPAIAEVCHLYGTRYLCWTVDCPVPELFSPSIQYDTNQIFLFDRAQYDDIAGYNPGHIHHLPLASAVQRFDQVITGIDETDRRTYGSDISFVGSLYSEKNPLHTMTSLSEYAKGYIRGIVDASLKIYGYNFLEEVMTPELIAELKTADPAFYHLENALADTDVYVAAHSYIGYHAAETERIRTLNTLAQYFPVDLYTRSDVSPLQNVRTHGGIQTLTEMPKVFHLSKINLNMTIKPIQTGLPLRIFDIMGCGGFLMTNYQEELTDHFEIGVDLEAYGSLEELVDKCAYYLEHEDERVQIARNGYEKVKKNHSYLHRIKEMIRCLG